MNGKLEARLKWFIPAVQHACDSLSLKVSTTSLTLIKQYFIDSIFVEYINKSEYARDLFMKGENSFFPDFIILNLDWEHFATYVDDEYDLYNALEEFYTALKDIPKPSKNTANHEDYEW